MDYSPYILIYIFSLLIRYFVYLFIIRKGQNKDISPGLESIIILVLFASGVFSALLLSALLGEPIKIMKEIFLELLLVGVIIEAIIFLTSYQTTVSMKRTMKKSIGGRQYTCNDGHKVRSRGELIIDNWLARMNINHNYEKVLEINGKRLKYDWFLPEFDVYIEYWGYYTKQYKQRRKVKEHLYEVGKKEVISIENDDLYDVNKSLQKILGKYVKKSKSRPRYCYRCGADLSGRYDGMEKSSSFLDKIFKN
ncbi:MAG: hypothetical protein ACTSWN_02055 [Promethearchaeota archaeon]